MFTDQDLFVDGQVPPYDCANMDADGDGIPDELDMCPDTLHYFIENGLVDENGCSPDSLPPSTSSSPTSSIRTPQPTPNPTPNPTTSFDENFTTVNTIFASDSTVTTVGCDGSNDVVNKRAIDKTTEKFYCIRNSSEPAGVVVHPSHEQPSIAKALRVYSHNNCGDVSEKLSLVYCFHLHLFFRIDLTTHSYYYFFLRHPTVRSCIIHCVRSCRHRR